MSRSDRIKGAKAKLTARAEPFWLNPATIKGTVAIGGGGAILLFPGESLFILRVVLGVALIITGVGDLWFHLRGRRPGNRVRDLAEGVLTVGLGALFLVFPAETLKVIMLIVGVYFGVRGVIVTIGAIKQRGSDTWALDLARGLFFIVFAGFMLLLPEAVFSGFVVALAAAAVVVGGVILSYGIQHHTEETLVDVDAASVSQIVRDWMMLRDVGDARRDEIDDGLYFEQPDRTNKLVAWWVMLLLSVAIATFGVLQDSTAVVIGAMLIAPLMTPIIGAALGAVNGWPKRVTTSLGMIAAGVSASVGLAFVIGAWTPQLIPLATNSQVTSRVSPNIIDMGIALAAGAAGAFANANKRVSASIAGVAIAVALVPPLGVVGLTLHAGMYGDAFGAFLLFMTNLVSIILAAMVVFALTGVAPVSKMKENANEIKRVAITVTIAAIIIAIPLAFTVSSIITNAARQAEAQKATETWLEDSPDLELDRINVKGSEVSIVITGPESMPPVPDLEDALSESFGKPVTVEVEHIPAIVVVYSDADGEIRTEVREDR
ncbi:MAG: DUF389 domain-containing protein [Actinomycetota bacterium]|nr:DUF389 domain-containing protein [Actinomycetota bacterium]